ncbi:MAG TPA: UvrB/UvrC motif-containing protein [Gemmatimonadota bacterium]|nr:UvrB/UvrC motif-containing protein [Gemmatimonadota bacterium]
MLCADCQKNKAIVHFTQIVNDETETFHLCQSCAQARGLKTTPSTSQVPLSDFLYELGAPIFTKATSANLSCPRCGCTFRQFRKTGRLGCAECYTTFEQEMSALLRKIHGSNEHVGILESEGIEPQDDRQAQMADLRRRLRQAVDSEEYERAAELRDQIVEIEEERRAVGQAAPRSSRGET